MPEKNAHSPNRIFKQFTRCRKSTVYHKVTRDVKDSVQSRQWSGHGHDKMIPFLENPSSNSVKSRSNYWNRVWTAGHFYFAGRSWVQRKWRPGCRFAP